MPLYISYSYVRRVDTQPVFKFRINQGDFYINTYGVSVTETAKSATTLSNGTFYVFNRNNFPVYFNKVQPVTIKFRNENGYPGTSLQISYSGTTADTINSYDSYLVKFKGNNVGLLKLSTPLTYINNPGSVLYPFQSIEMGVTYQVLNVNRVALQYYGYSKTNPNRTHGVIDIGFNITSFLNADLTSLTTDNMNVSVNLIYTQYVPLGVSMIGGTTYIGGGTGVILGGYGEASFGGVVSGGLSSS